MHQYTNIIKRSAHILYYSIPYSKLKIKLLCTCETFIRRNTIHNKTNKQIKQIATQKFTTLTYIIIFAGNCPIHICRIDNNETLLFSKPLFRKLIRRYSPRTFLSTQCHRLLQSLGSVSSLTYNNSFITSMRQHIGKQADNRWRTQRGKGGWQSKSSLLWEFLRLLLHKTAEIFEEIWKKTTDTFSLKKSLLVRKRRNHQENKGDLWLRSCGIRIRGMLKHFKIQQQ